MPKISINQTVNVHWRLHGASSGESPKIDDEVTRSFNNLIPACEFAVSMSQEGDREISLHPDTGPVLDLADAQRIKAAWESGKVSLEAEEMEF